MSYQVLSLKLRPQRFDDVVGQIHVTRTLQNAIELDRLAHGYIFSGQRGVGKTTTARILAKVLNCEKPEKNNPCRNCTSCLEITKGSNLDVQELDGATNRGIDEIRDLREAIKYPPNRGKYRIYIIDEVHMLTREAFNALLKTLEEPPPHVIFIMATTDAHKVPPTILSRTQRFDFKPISVNEISNYIKKILDLEKTQYDLEGIDLIAQKASGSLRDALSLIDQVIAYASGNLEIDIVRDLLGVIKENIFLDIVISIEQKDNRGIIKQLNTILDEGYSISDFIVGFNEYLRKCMLLKTGEQGKIKISDESTRWVDNCRFSISDFLRMLDLSLQFESSLKFIQQAQISLESLFIKLSMMDSSIDIAQVLGSKTENIFVKRPESKQKRVSKEKATTETDQTSSPKTEKSLEDKSTNKKLETQEDTISVPKQDLTPKVNITFEDIKTSWPEIISSLEKTNSKIAHFLENIILTSFDGTQVLIELINGHRFHVNTLEKDAGKIESIMAEILKQKIKIKFHIKKKSGNELKNKKTKNAEHPLFMKVLETFDGEIIR